MKKSKIRPDYVNLPLEREDYERVFFRSLLILTGVGYLFYRSWLVAWMMPPFFWFACRRERERKSKARRRALELQFKEGITFLLAGLEAGYSVENAFGDASRELGKTYREETDLEREFRFICQGIRLNESLESMLFDLAMRSGLEDVRSFAEVFEIARKKGGDLIAILKASIGTLQEKMEVRREIDALLAGKKLEQGIMSLVPPGILLYVNLTSPEFLSGLYGNAVGVLVMSGCLVTYGLSIVWGKRIVEVEV